jgi:hypothetical protein
MSEALSTSSSLGLLSALLWLRERWTVPRLVLVALLAFGATALRDSNGTFLGCLGVLLVLAAIALEIPRRVFGLAGVFLVIAALGSLSASVGRRWEGPLKDVITIRVLNSPERTTYFEKRGMPLTPTEIAASRGSCVAPSGGLWCVTLSNPAFYQWIRDHGRSTYMRSLIRYPATTLWEPLGHLGETVAVRVPLELLTKERAPVSQALETFVFVRNVPFLALWAVVTLIACIVAFVRGWRGVYLLGAALVALTYPHLLLVWLGGALEVPRHSLLASFQLRLGLWLTGLWLLDAYLAQRSTSPSASVVET